MTTPGSVGRSVRTVAWALVVTLTTVATLLVLLGWRPVVLLSDSMRPTAPAGSLVLSRPVDASEVAVGDVITVGGDRARPLTHRVIALERTDDGVLVRLRGDANEEPDPGRVALDDEVLRAFAVVPVAGRVLGSGAPLLVVGLLVLTVGVRGLRRQWPDRADDVATEHPTRRLPERARVDDGRAASAPRAADPRIAALAASLEAVVEDGLHPEVGTTLARVRFGELLGGGRVEQHASARDLDDGGRFVLFSLVDADVEALRLVPATSARQRSARAVVDRWWSTVPPDALAQLGDEERRLVERRG